MFIGIGTNNGLRKLRQERHGTIRLLQSDMPLLTELDSRGIASAINMPLLTELSPTGRPRQLRQELAFSSTVYAKSLASCRKRRRKNLMGGWGGLPLRTNGFPLTTGSEDQLMF